jgi:uncharacterized membrane protein
MELWKSTHLWLTTCGNKVDKTFCKEEVTSHPDYPALTALVDFLDIGGMSYSAVQSDATYIDQFSYPLLAHLAIPGASQMRMVKNIEEWSIAKDSLQYWSGVVVQPVKGSSWACNKNTAYIQKKLKNRVFISGWALIGLILYINSIIEYPNLLMNTFGFLSLAGLLISLALVSMELGLTSQIVKQICGTISPKGCEKVVKNKYAKGYAGITIADISLAYFATQFPMYLISCLYHGLGGSLLLVAFAGIFISIGSIYVQSQKIKAWCALCLGVVSVLMAQCVIAMFLFSFVSVDFGLIAWPIGLTIALIIELPIKDLIKSNLFSRIELSKFKKWRQDPTLFHQQWNVQQSVDQSIWSEDLIIGNRNADIQITVACNPYCVPCANAHVQLDRLLDNHGEKIAVKMRFLSFGVEEKDSPHATAVAAILRKASTLTKGEDLREMLSDWFHHMNFDTWNQKWQVSSDKPVKDRLAMHSEWVSKSNIESTPTFFINGKKLPDRYSLEDVELLIPGLLGNQELR